MDSRSLRLICPERQRFPLIPWATQRTPRSLRRNASIPNHWPSIHKYVPYPNGVVHRIFERGHVLNRIRIEDCNIRKHSRPKNAAIHQAHAAGC